MQHEELKMRYRGMRRRATALSYLELPVPIRAVAEGRPVWVANAGIGGCLCECDRRVVGLRGVSDLTDIEPLTLWLAAVERRARRKQRRAELPYPVLCERRAGDHDLLSLTGVRPDGAWLGHDEDGSLVRVRLPEVVTVDTTEEYLGEICGATHFWDRVGMGRAASCTRG